MIKKALNILEGFFYTWGFEINMWTLNSWLTELDIRYQCYYLDLMSSCILWMEIAYCTTHWDYNIPCNLLKNCIRVKVVTVFIWSNIVVPFFFKEYSKSSQYTTEIVFWVLISILVIVISVLQIPIFWQQLTRKI